MRQRTTYQPAQRFKSSANLFQGGGARPVAQEPNENIGVADAYLRLAGGITLLALGAGRKLGRVGSFLAVLIGASKVAEGITRYCPVYDMMDLTSLDGKVRRLETPLQPSEGPEPVPATQPEEPPDAPAQAPVVARTFPWDHPLGESDRQPGDTEQGTAVEPSEPPEKRASARTARTIRPARPAIKRVGKRAPKPQ